MDKNKIKGMFLGVAIGDALGMAVETFQYERIQAEYGRVSIYLSPAGHKWFNGEPAGGTTDDWQLTAAVAEGLIEAGLDLTAHVRWHIKVMQEGGTKGWGGTTKNAIRNLANGASWLNSGIKGPGKGKGNGVAMKIAPLAATNFRTLEKYDFACRLALMTHPTEMGVSSGFAQLTAAHYCLSKTPKTFNRKDFITICAKACMAGRRFGNRMMRLDPEEDSLAVQILRLHSGEWPTPEIVKEFGRGSCYCFNSLPFTYAFFVRNPLSIDSLYDVVSAGGDTDTNGSMLAALLGALHGPGIFPSELVDGLVNRDAVLDLAERFCAKF
jgi:ADP-ribosyl-[dinitrogen reductase] hydrolase